MFLCRNLAYIILTVHPKNRYPTTTMRSTAKQTRGAYQRRANADPPPPPRRLRYRDSPSPAPAT